MMGRGFYRICLNTAALGLMLTLAACGQPASHAVKPVLYLCDGNAKLSAVYDLENRRIHLAFGAMELDLDQTPAADGARFSDGISTFWDHGPEANLQLAADPQGMSCHIQE